MAKSNLEGVELRIATLLRYGVIVSGFLLFVSMLMLVLGYPAAQELGHWGLWLLVCLPVLRVLTTALVFLYEKEFTMFVIATTVLFLLSFSFSMGWGTH